MLARAFCVAAVCLSAACSAELVQTGAGSAEAPEGVFLQNFHQEIDAKGVPVDLSVTAQQFRAQDNGVQHEHAHAHAHAHAHDHDHAHEHQSDDGAVHKCEHDSTSEEYTHSVVTTPQLYHFMRARPLPIPFPCTQSTRAGIAWRRCHRAAGMARSYQEHHRSVRARP